MASQCEKTLENGLALMGLQLPVEALYGLCRYFAELGKWSRKMNLVAQADDLKILETHFLDSLTLLPLLASGQGLPRLMDVGSGAGFPGLPLKIARPDLPVTLVEPRRKRVFFLRHVIRTLGLADIEALEARVETGSNILAGEARRFPLITSRAVAGLGDFLALCAPFSPTGGKVICMKGPKAGEEIRAWRRTGPKSPYTLAETFETALPFSRAGRTLLVFVKENRMKE